MKRMSKSVKMLALTLFVLPVMFVLSACGMTTEQVFNERIPMLTIPNGEYRLVSWNANGHMLDLSSQAAFETSAVTIHETTYPNSMFGSICPSEHIEDWFKAFAKISVIINESVMTFAMFLVEGGSIENGLQEERSLIHALYRADAFGELTFHQNSQLFGSNEQWFVDDNNWANRTVDTTAIFSDNTRLVISSVSTEEGQSGGSWISENSFDIMVFERI